MFLGASSSDTHTLRTTHARPKTTRKSQKEPAFNAIDAKDKLKTERFEGFRPHLCISPPATIVQTVRGVMGHFPDFRCIVYFATASTFPIKGAMT